ncbi:MAG TPA: hypothetical protein VHE10_01995 [Candidatus Paceibacterota bacterium]|nr:hypothetical protein [Candidatus Paceibacterota bacterium]
MKAFAALLFILLVCAGAYYFFMNTTLFDTSYQSLDLGIRFSHASDLLVRNSANGDGLDISDSSLDKEVVLIRRYRNDTFPGEDISFRIAREFGSNMFDEKDATFNHIDGLAFEWQGEKGRESAFAFQSGLYDIVVSTFGMPDRNVARYANGVLGSLEIVDARPDTGEF